MQFLYNLWPVAQLILNLMQRAIWHGLRFAFKYKQTEKKIEKNSSNNKKKIARKREREKEQ